MIDKDKLKMAMLKSGFSTNKQFAKHINKTENTVSNIINGKTSISIETAVEWANILHIPRKEFVDVFIRTTYLN